ncbi:hypothetical protein [Halomonas sp. LBP4]|uniref:hypothetical protein n=1 Tax=Halomonas sp. LBP4 TaxID=2044917 RepID=UPI0021AB9F88|nr:hypothetical protein [Halomonas sp. LBP4]
MTTPSVPCAWRLGLALLVLPVATALAGDGHDLSFQGDASFQGPHADQAVQVALVDADSGEVVAREAGSVSADEDPAFAFDFPGALQAGQRYEVHYWIDSNFNDGSAGACDPKSQDHQWRVELGEASEAVTHTEEHAPARMAEVCTTFEE